MRKPNILTARQLKEEKFYKRELKHVDIDVFPNDECFYNDEELTTVDFIVRKNDYPLGDIINSVYDVPVTYMDKMLSYLIEIYAPDNYIERHIIEFKSLDNRCIEGDLK